MIQKPSKAHRKTLWTIILVSLVSTTSFAAIKIKQFITVKQRADAIALAKSKIPASEYYSEKKVSINDTTGNAKTIGYSSIVLNPNKIAIFFYTGWNREQEANRDKSAVVFASGPTFELHSPNGKFDFTAHGDIKALNGTFISTNSAASESRASIGFGKDGKLDFGYGSLKSRGQEPPRYFIGGMHALTNTVKSPPSEYKGVYKQQMRLSDIRIVYGLRKDGRLEIIETNDGVSFPDLKTLVNKIGFLAAYLPDHASKSRLIVPFKRVWSEEHAIWVSGGRPKITQMPMMIKFVAIKIDKGK